MTTLFVSVEDLIGEDTERVVARAAEWGCTELAVSFAYHAARDVTPHGPNKVTLRRDGVYFAPSQTAFDGSGLVPSVLNDDAAFGETVTRAARSHDISVVGWAVFLHNEDLGTRHPDVTQENCFGDRAAPAALCPANPRVRRYCVELAVAVAGQDVHEVVAESLHYDAFEHGYHHERDFVGLGVLERFLLGLCFCEHCLAAMLGSGVDVLAACESAGRIVEQQLNGGAAAVPDESDLTLELLRVVCGDALHDYVLARVNVVSGLVESVADALSALKVRLCFIDLMGAVQGYGDGMPGPSSGVDEGWRLGIDIRTIANFAGVAVLAYAREPDRVADEVRQYRSVIDEVVALRAASSSMSPRGREQNAPALRVILRPGRPDCDEPSNLVAKVVAVRTAGADSVDFYHYGLFPFPVLDRIQVALAENDGSVAT